MFHKYLFMTLNSKEMNCRRIFLLKILKNPLKKQIARPKHSRLFLLLIGVLYGASLTWSTTQLGREHFETQIKAKHI